MTCYLDTSDKSACFGCEACVQACPKSAIRMVADDDGFRYPQVDRRVCTSCHLCRQVCPSNRLLTSHDPICTFGGYVIDEEVRNDSTSGGAFSAIVQTWADKETLVFGAEARGLDVRHIGIKGTSELSRLRKSKYLQSEIGSSFCGARNALLGGKRVVFSGTPCQIAALRTFLGNADTTNLLLIEVVCEGVPTPNYIKKFVDWLGKKKCGVVTTIDYRHKDGRKWDFEVMQASLQNPDRGTFKWKQDRWFNPFWSIWLQHLISRPSCYVCPFAKRARSADITLGDLWGVHLYCPDLYGRNGGASVIFCNTAKGIAALEKAKPLLYGRVLNTDEAIRYQGPMREHIKGNPDRARCLKDIRELPYEKVIRKWAKPPTLKLLWQKYVWGNCQKVWLWSLFHRKEIAND